MSISLHIIVDNASDEQLDRALRYLKRTNQKLVNIAAGAQLDRGMTYVERVRADVPGIKVFWRHLEDTGIWTKLTPAQWYTSRVQPRLAWAQRNNLVFVTDNESSGDNVTIENYVRWQRAVMAELHEQGLHAAVGRFATGNISEDQYGLLKPMFDAIQPGDYFSPNEYFNAPGKSSGGHLNRYKLGWLAAGHNLPTAIGEFGMAVDYQSDKGFHSIGMLGKDYARLVIEHSQAWYEAQGVTPFLYCVGGYSWPTFQLNEEVYGELEAYAARNEPPVIVTPPIVTNPPAPVPEVSEPATKPPEVDLLKNEIGALLRSIAADLNTLADKLDKWAQAEAQPLT